MELKPSYKRTDIGAIPDDWNVTALGEIGETIIGLTYAPSNVRPYGLLVLRSSNIENSDLTFDDTVYVDLDVPERLIVRENDILVCVRNGSRRLIGKCALVDGRAKGMTFGAFMSVFRTKHAEFVFHQFQSDVVKRQINENIGATINQITNQNLNSFRIPIPRDQREEQAIVAALSDVDALISGLDRLIAKKRAIKQATMQQLLAGRMRLPGFSREWNTQKIGQIAPLQRGFDLPTTELEMGVHPVVYSNGILNYHSSFKAKGPGVVTGRSGTIGKVNYVEKDYWPHNTSLWVTDFKGNVPQFIYYLYTFIGFEKFGTGSGVPTLNRNDVHAYQVSIPSSREEQTTIAAVLSDMDAEIAALEQQRDKTRLLKQGMMQELLTGRIRLV